MDDNPRQQLSEKWNVNVDGEGDRDRRAPTCVDINTLIVRSKLGGGDTIKEDFSILTVEDEGVSHSDAGRGVGQGDSDAIMKDFERKLDQIATEYRKSLEDYDYNDDLTLELEKSRATIDELNKLVARERETSEELKRKLTAEVAKLSSNSEESFEHFLKETVALNKELKGKDDRNNELTLELEKSRATIEELSQLLEQSAARDKKMLGEFKRASTEIRELSTLKKRHINQLTALILEKDQLDKDIADLKKRLKEKDDLAEKLEKENREMRIQLKKKDEQSQNSTPLEENLTRINESLLTMSTEIQLLKTQVKGGGEMIVEVRSKAGTVKLHRYFNKHLQDHFYTTDWAELGAGKYGYIHEGVIGHVFPSPVEGTVPLFIYWNRSSKDHAYTSSKTEFRGGKGGYSYKGISCYIFPSPPPEEGTKPLFRYHGQIKKDHLLTTNLWELGHETDGYLKDGILGYVY